MQKAASHSYTVQTDKRDVRHNRSALVDLREEDPVTPKPNNHQPVSKAAEVLGLNKSYEERSQPFGDACTKAVGRRGHGFASKPLSQPRSSE